MITIPHLITVYFIPEVAQVQARIAQLDREERAWEKARDDARMHLDDDEYERADDGLAELPQRTEYLKERRNLVKLRNQVRTKSVGLGCMLLGDQFCDDVLCCKGPRSSLSLGRDTSPAEKRTAGRRQDRST